MSVCTKRLLLFACVSLTFLLMVFPAAPRLAAQQPHSQTIQVDDTIPGFVSCEGFDVTAHVEGTIKITDAGRFPSVRQHLHGSFTNEVTGFSRPFVVAYTLRVIQSDEESETDLITGLQTIVTVPGQGFVVGDAGRQILRFSNFCPTCPPEVIFEAGHSTTDGSFVPKLCSALSQ
jgi:hypothetical protein